MCKVTSPVSLSWTPTCHCTSQILFFESTKNKRAVASSNRNPLPFHLLSLTPNTKFPLEHKVRLLSCLVRKLHSFTYIDFVGWISSHFKQVLFFFPSWKKKSPVLLVQEWALWSHWVDSKLFLASAACIYIRFLANAIQQMLFFFFYFLNIKQPHKAGLQWSMMLV